MCILSLVIYYRLFVKSETPIWGVGPFIYCRIKGEGGQVGFLCSLTTGKTIIRPGHKPLTCLADCNHRHLTPARHTSTTK